jgi:hypothetical protein
LKRKCLMPVCEEKNTIKSHIQEVIVFVISHK